MKKKFFSVTSKSIMGVKTKLVGMDLGVNSRSLVFTRRRARVQGWILLLRSILQNKDSLIMGSMPKTDKLSASLLEVSCMHARAIRRGFNSNSEWILILEDDAILCDNFCEEFNKYINDLPKYSRGAPVVFLSFSNSLFARSHK